MANDWRETMETETSAAKPLWQPTLEGPRLRARPLRASDFDALFAAASDPLIWELHPVRDRYTRPKFDIYFKTGMASNGALVVESRTDGTVIGSSRFSAYDPVKRTVEIGYTFLKRDHWNTGANRELKCLMLQHAFQHVDTVEFVVGVRNLRSRGAMEKLGGQLVRTLAEVEPEGDLRESVVYAITREIGENLIASMPR